MSVCLLCLIGLPGSGKTTLAASLKRCFAESGMELVCVEYDLHIADIHCTRGEWKRQRQKLLDDVRRSASELKENGRKNVVILDDNFYYRSMRYEVYRIAKELRLGFGQIFLDVPFDICSARNSSRPNPVASEVLSRMKTLVEAPEPLKNPWERHSLILSTNPVNPGQILELVENTWEKPYFPQPDFKTPPHDNSAIHYADLALRKLVKLTVMSVPPEQRSHITQNLINKKKSLLEDIRMGNIELPIVDCNTDVVRIYANVFQPYFSDLHHE